MAMWDVGGVVRAATTVGMLTEGVCIVLFETEEGLLCGGCCPGTIFPGRLWACGIGAWLAMGMPLDAGGFWPCGIAV